MTKEHPYTFNDWMKGTCGPVKKISKHEVPEYQSEYVYRYNYLRDKGWEYDKGWWIKDDSRCKNIYQAYDVQKFRDEVINGDN